MQWLTIGSLTLFAGSLLFLPLPQDNQEPDDMKWQAYQMEDLVKQLGETGQPWLPFLVNDTLITGVYRLKAGATDDQSPHDKDEVYYVVEGQARFVVNDESCVAKPGSLLFVAAGEDHRFVDIEKDLTLLVFFSKALPQ